MENNTTVITHTTIKILKPRTYISKDYYYESILLDVEEFMQFVEQHNKMCFLFSKDIDETNDSGVEVYKFFFTERDNSTPEKRFRGETENKSSYWIAFTDPKEKTSFRIFREKTLTRVNDLIDYIKECYFDDLLQQQEEEKQKN